MSMPKKVFSGDDCLRFATNAAVETAIITFVITSLVWALTVVIIMEYT